VWRGCVAARATPTTFLATAFLLPDDGRVTLRQRLARLDDRARVADESPTAWFSILVFGALTAVVVVAAATRRWEVVFFVPVVVGVYVGKRWARRE
jgi:Flp pilus assembly protein TadB